MTDPTELVEEQDGAIAWLVEFPPSGDAYRNGKRVGPATPTRWLCAIPKGDRVLSRTSDANEALRFCRKIDAERMLARLDSDSLFAVGVKTGGFACEHMWHFRAALASIATPTASETSTSDKSSCVTPERADFTQDDGLVEWLRDGVRSMGLHDDQETELFDIEDADEAMCEAAAHIEHLTTRPPTAGTFADGVEAAAKVVERRMERRFAEHGTTEPDTNASYYSGRAAELFESLDEEAEDCATAIRALALTPTDQPKGDE